MMKKNKPPPMLHDPLIIPRVKEYLEENVHQTYVDVSVMARELQDRYREYNRRKTVPFRLLVEQAYKTVLQSYGLDSNPSSDNEANSDLELMDDAGQPNHMNDTLNNMYTNNKNKNSAQPPSNDEAIDISSDESDGDIDEMPTTTSTTKSSNLTNAQDYNIRGVTITKLKQPLATCNTDRFEQQRKQPSTNDRRDRNYDRESDRTYDRERHVDRGERNDRFYDNRDRGGDRARERFEEREVAQLGKKRRHDGSNIPADGAYPLSVPPTKQKKFKNPIQPKWTCLKFKDVGGMEKILKELCELLLHIKHPEVYDQVGVAPPRGFLLHGPPGSGKTLLANAIAGQLQIPLIRVIGTELIGGVSGESEERIRDLFDQASALSPCVLFIDEIDSISSNRLNASKDMERRVVTQLISCLDGLSQEAKGNQVLVIGATNRPDNLDPGLRRVGRFDHEISLGIPDRDAREQILRIICQRLSIQRPFDFRKLATLTPGYVGADLVALATRAASSAVKKIFTKRGEINAEKRFLRQQALLAKKSTIPPVVNLTDDTVLMEVDGDEKSTQAENNEEKTQNDINDVTAVEENKEAESKEAEKKVDDTNKDVDEDLVDISMEIQDGNKEKSKEGTEEDKSDKNDVVESTEKETEKNTENDNNGTSTTETEKATQETANSTTNEKSDKYLDDIYALTENIIDNIINDNESTSTKTSDLNEAVLNQPNMKYILTLNEMVSWLNNKTTPLTNKDLDNICITFDDFLEALKVVQPSAKREGFITVPDVTWDDIGSLRDIREELKLAVLAPVKFPEKLKILGLTAPSGVLLCGPPGCGKTLLAKAVANEAGINFISVKGPELLNMYVGESERAVRLCFQRARNSAPCVIFFDEFDSLCPKRSDVGEGGAGARVVNQLLTEMDGIEDRKGVFLMAATNRPDIVDPAVLRPGRLDKILYIGLPTETDRIDILTALTKNRTKPNLASDVSFEELAGLTKGFTGADLAGLVRQSSLHCLKDYINLEQTISIEDETSDELSVTKSHFLQSLNEIKPSVSVEDQKHYEKLRQKYAAPNQLKSKTF